MESYVRVHDRKRKQEIIDGFILAKAHAANVGVILSGKGKFLEPYDFYTVFQEEDTQHQDNVMSEYTQKRKEAALRFNRRFARNIESKEVNKDE